MLDLTDRTIEYSEFVPRKIKVAIPCYDDGGYKLAICKVAFLKEGLLPSKLGRWFFKPHGITNITNKLPKHLAGYDPICSSKPLLSVIKAAAAATDDEWRGLTTTKRLHGMIGSAMLTLNQGGYVLYGQHYSRMPKGYEYLIPPFRLTEVESVLEYDDREFIRTHTHKRTTYKFLTN